MDNTQSWIVVLGLAIGTFLIRYSFIGLLADRDMPQWLERALRLMVPAIFSAIVLGGVVMVGTQVADFSHWPRYAAAIAAVIAAIVSRGSMLLTVIVGMAVSHGLPWLLR